VNQAQGAVVALLVGRDEVVVGGRLGAVYVGFWIASLSAGHPQLFQPALRPNDRHDSPPHTARTPLVSPITLTPVSHDDRYLSQGIFGCL
jgi:hypothetical protein